MEVDRQGLVLHDELEVEDEEFLLYSSSHGVLHCEPLHLDTLNEVLVLEGVRVDCARGRREWLPGARVVLRVLVLHGVVVLAVGHHRLAHVGVDVVARAHEDGLAIHCHGVVVLKLDDLVGRLEDEDEVVVDLHRLKYSKRYSLSVAFLMMKTLKICGRPTLHESRPFRWTIWR